MGVRWIELRWRGRCSRCRAELGAGELARFDDVTHAVSCFDCDERARTARRAMAERAARSRRPATVEAERDRVRALIADARAALDAAHRAS